MITLWSQRFFSKILVKRHLVFPWLCYYPKGSFLIFFVRRHLASAWLCSGLKDSFLKSSSRDTLQPHDYALALRVLFWSHCREAPCMHMIMLLSQGFFSKVLVEKHLVGEWLLSPQGFISKFLKTNQRQIYLIRIFQASFLDISSWQATKHTIFELTQTSKLSINKTFFYETLTWFYKSHP